MHALILEVSLTLILLVLEVLLHVGIVEHILILAIVAAWGLILLVLKVRNLSRNVATLILALLLIRILIELLLLLKLILWVIVDLLVKLILMLLLHVLRLLREANILRCLSLYIHWIVSTWRKVITWILLTHAGQKIRPSIYNKLGTYLAD